MTMKERLANHKRCREGATLIIILVMVCIVTILVIGYLGTVQIERSATQSYSERLSAEQIALGGLDRQVADFQQEIIAGSYASNDPGGNAGAPVYYKPITYQGTNLSMVPARYTDTAALYTNLIRISATNGTYFTNAYPSAYYTQSQLPAILASACSTTNPAPNGSYISTTRWQMPVLLLTNETMPAPDWILMTRSGPTNASELTFGSTGNTLNNRAASNTNYVVGRYAYVVYDEGGLLDVTVAGAPTNATADDIGNRGSLALAPLTNSVFSTNVFATVQAATNVLNALVSWRNPVTAATETNYTSYVYGVITNYTSAGTYTTNAAATNGFLQVQPGDNTFLSRQDLIAYATYAGMTNALPYLGTFSRDVNAPACVPNVVSGNANEATYNVDPLTLRFANSGIVNNPSTGTYNLLQQRNVSAGAFLLTKRFPLSRLSWVGYNGPANGASAADVWRAFGLVFDNNAADSTYNSWIYVSGAGSSMPTAPYTAATSINPLSEVMGESTVRDPDFFELLQAGILNGSLGQTGGAQEWAMTTALEDWGGSGDTSGYDSVQSYQIMQIGANILNQASPANFPIAISFGPDSRDKFVNNTTGAATTSYGSPRTFYGVANLPYINRFIDTFVRWITPPSPLSNSDKLPNGAWPGKSTYTQPYLGAWILFELWNPHQSANFNTSSKVYPSAFRIAATGQICEDAYSWTNVDDPRYDAYSVSLGTALGTGNNSGNSPAGSTGPGPTAWTTWAAATNYIELNSLVASANFLEPTLVTSTDLTTGYSSESSYTAVCVQSGAKTTGSGANGTGGNPFVGLFVGSSYAPDYNYCTPTNSPSTGLYAPVTATTTNDPACVTYNDCEIIPNTNIVANNVGVTYEMQYEDSSGTWRPYGLVKSQTLTAQTPLSYSKSTTTTDYVDKCVTNSGCYAEKTDPRTDRFSTFRSRSGDSSYNAIAMTGTNYSVRPGAPGYPDNTGQDSDEFLPYDSGGVFWLGTPNKPPIPPKAPGTYYPGGILENTTASSIYYKDPDGTIRPGDAYYNTGIPGTTTTIAAGRPGFPNNVDSSSNVNLARPVILNRPFRSVGELGYVDRDMPWKTLDFFTKESGDAALLDYFSVSDADVVAGRININTHNPQALAEVLSGTAIEPLYARGILSSPLTASQANTLANALVAFTATQPLRSRAELVTMATGPASVGGSAATETILSGNTTAYTAQNSKIEREAPIRTLSEAGNARTWNLLIDIIAQSGHYPPTLQSGASLSSFIPDGEKRYWLHVAIDRYTGQVVDRFLEPVQE